MFVLDFCDFGFLVVLVGIWEGDCGFDVLFYNVEGVIGDIAYCERVVFNLFGLVDNVCRVCMGLIIVWWFGVVLRLICFILRLVIGCGMSWWVR